MLAIIVPWAQGTVAMLQLID